MFYKRYTYRLLPTEEQKVLLIKNMGCCRYVYNWGLDYCSKEYQKNKRTPTSFDVCLKLTELKHTEGYEWLNEAYSTSLQLSVRRLGEGFTNFFRGISGHPKFKTKKNIQKCEYIHISVFDSYIKIPKIGNIKYINSRNIPDNATVKSAVISLNKIGYFNISILLQFDIEEPKKKEIKSDTTIGVDLGISHYAILSNGLKFENQKPLIHYLKRLRVEQRKLQRCKIGSKNREKQKIVVAKIHEKIKNKRRYIMHHIANYLVNNYDTICVESLSIKNLIKNKRLSKHIGDAAWGLFICILKEKCEWNGKNLIQIDKYAPSSKRCSCCGYIYNDLKLDIRSWLCPNCGTFHDRDINAATNIKLYGLGVKPYSAKTRQ